MNRSKLKKLKVEWINRLRLTEYNIKLFTQNMEDMLVDMETPCFGYCNSCAVHLEARICLLDMDDDTWEDEALGFPEEYTTDQRMEQTLVHELVHIFFEHSRSPESVVTEEQSVVRLTNALMSLKYTAAPKKPRKKSKKGKK